MIKGLMEICLRKRHVIWGLVVFFVCLGIYALFHIKVEAYPELSDVNVIVQTQVSGLAAEEVEKQITIPLERALATTDGMVTIRSSSTFALSLITMIFKEGTGEYFARQRVLNALGDAILPDGVEPQITPLTGSTGEIYRYVLQSNEKNLMELSEIQRWIVIPELRQVKGVSDIVNFGGFTKEFQLLMDPLKLYSFDVSLNEIRDAVNNNNRNVGGGRVTRGEQNYVVRGISKIQNLADMGNIYVKQHQGTPVYLNNLGVLKYGHKERQGVVGFDYDSDAVQGIIVMRKWEYPSEVLKEINQKINTLKKVLDPMGVKIFAYLDRTNLIEMTSHQVTRTVLEGILVVTIILLFFLKNLRCSLVVASSIPISMIFMFILVYLTDMSANLFSLGSIDFGVIVDGSIVIMESLLRRREEKPNDELSINDTLNTSYQVARPIFYATLIIMATYLPLLAFEHAEGRIFRPMAFIICYALLGALMCALMLVPGLTYVSLKNPRPLMVNHFIENIVKKYKVFLNQLIYKRQIIYWLTGCIFIFVFYLGSSVGSEFLPELDEGAFWLQVKLPTGISLEKAVDLSDNLRFKLLEFPEVKNVVSQLGRADTTTDPWTTSHLEVAVMLKPLSEWPDHETKAELVKKFDDTFAKMPGYIVGIGQPIIDNANELVSGAHAPLVLRVYGEDLHESRVLAEKLVKILKGIRGTAIASIYQEGLIPQMVVKMNRVSLARYGVDAEQVSDLIETNLVGKPISRVYVNKQIYDATARFPATVKANIDELGSLYIKNSKGFKIPISELASIDYQMGESTIAHENNKRLLIIRIEIRDRDLGSYLKEAKQQISKKVNFDNKKFALDWGGQFESQARAEKRLVYIFFVLLIIMGLLLFFEFKKLHLVLLLLGILPLATFGGLVTMHLTGETFNISTAVGFIALFGVSLQNGIIMISNIKRHYESQHVLRTAVVRGASERLRPILLTATVASCGMLPASLATGVGTDVQRNLASIIVGGLFFSTILTLFILPIFYYQFERAFQKGYFNFLRKLK